MVNFNPYEISSLENLLVALQGGLDPNQGYGMLADILAQQQARAATRKENMQGYASQLEGMAQAYPDRRSAMTSVNAWDTANLVGPKQADTLRDTVRTLYPEGRGTPSPLYAGETAESEPYVPTLPTNYGDIPSQSAITDLAFDYDNPAGGAYTENIDEMFTPGEIESVARQIALTIIEEGKVPRWEDIYRLLKQVETVREYATRFPESTQAIAQEVAYTYGSPTLSSLTGAG